MTVYSPRMPFGAEKNLHWVRTQKIENLKGQRWGTRENQCEEDVNKDSDEDGEGAGSSS